MSTAWVKSSTAMVPSSLRNFIRLSEARLQAESSIDMYSEHGLDAVIGPVFGSVCQRLIVVSYWTPGSAQVPVLVLGDGVHELVGGPYGVVGVLELDRGERVAVKPHIELVGVQRR